MRPGEPDYDPRTLFIPQGAWKEFTPFEKQVHVSYSRSLTIINMLIISVLGGL